MASVNSTYFLKNLCNWQLIQIKSIKSSTIKPTIITTTSKTIRTQTDKANTRTVRAEISYCDSLLYELSTIWSGSYNQRLSKRRTASITKRDCPYARLRKMTTMSSQEADASMVLAQAEAQTHAQCVREYYDMPYQVSKASESGSESESEVVLETVTQTQKQENAHIRSGTRFM